jgi:hypothetical protein
MLVRLFVAGFTVAELARLLGLSAQTVAAALEEAARLDGQTVWTAVGEGE